MLAFLTGHPEGTQRDLARAALADNQPGWWWAVAPSEEPITGTRFDDTPFEAMAALAARWANRTKQQLVVPSLDFHAPERTPVLGDHTPQTLELAKRTANESYAPSPAGLFVIDSLSLLYDQATQQTARTIPADFGERGIEIARLVAANAVNHLLWDLSRSMPVLACCWDDPGMGKPVAHAPRPSLLMADLVVEALGTEVIVRKASASMGWSESHTGTPLTDLIWGKPIKLSAA